MKSYSITILVLLLLGPGCATVHRAREAQREATTNVPPGERTVTAAELGLTSNSVVSLDDALRIALTNQPAVTQAREQLVAALAQIREARAAYLPTIDSGASYRKSTFNSAEVTERNTTRDSYNASLDADLLVYDFGKTPAVVRQARENVKAAEERLRSARSDVAFNVRSAYFNLGRSEELLQVADQAVSQFEEHLEQTRAFVEVGRRTRYDVTKAQVDLGNAQLDQIDAQDAVAAARAGLNQSLGLAQEPGYRIGDVVSEDIATDPDQLMTLARTNQPQLRALLAEQRAASSAVDAAISDLYPSLHLNGSYGASGSHFPLVWNWFGGVQASFGIFSGWEKTARIDENVAQFRAARSRVADQEQQIYLELSTALSTLKTARERETLSGLIVREAQESLDLITERYRLGKASAVEVTDAQVAVTRAEADQVSARFDTLTAIAQIKHTIGEE